MASGETEAGAAPDIQQVVEPCSWALGSLVEHKQSTLDQATLCRKWMEIETPQLYYRQVKMSPFLTHESESPSQPEQETQKLNLSKEEAICWVQVALGLWDKVYSGVLGCD